MTTDCQEVRSAMSGETLRPGIAADVTEHLDACDACRRFAREARARSSLLEQLSPRMSARQSTEILQRLRVALSQMVGR